MQVIDALVITLGLDPSKFQKGQKEVQGSLKNTREDATRTAKDLEADGKKAAQFFSKIRNEAIALTAALVGANGFKQFIGAMVTSDAAIGRLSKNVGMSVEDLSAWEQVAARSGGTAAGMASSIKNIATQIAMLDLNGTNDIIQFLISAGVNTAKFNDHATTMQERLLLIADVFKKMSPAEAQFRGSQMGLDEGTINVLMLGRQELEKLRIEQEKISITTKKQAEAAQDLEQSWNKLGESLKNTGRKMYPLLTEFNNNFSNALDHGLHSKVVKNPPPENRQPNWFRGILPDSWIDYLTTGEVSQPGRRKMSGRVVGESGRAPRGIRNNNPGNLNFAGQSGASLESGPNARFAAFGSMPEGVAALVHQLQLYKSRGIDSIQDIIKLYAPSSENNTGAYISALSKQMGVAPGQHLALDDVSTLRSLIAGISMIENGHGRLGIGDINSGIAMSGVGGSRSTTTVNIAKVDVHTQATDVKGMADAFASNVRVALQAHRSVQ